MSRLCLQMASIGAVSMILLICGACGTPVPGPARSTAPIAGPSLAPAPATITPHPPFAIVQQADIFTLYGMEGDQQALANLTAALLSYAPHVSRDLDYDYRSAITVEIFQNQASLDLQGMNPHLQGYYAYSGSHRIQMVSPHQPLPGDSIPYKDRVLIAVHEFVHLVENEINPDLPAWLNEGVAVYIGPHAAYDEICRDRFPFAMLPAFQDLELAYDTLPAADLFAYTAVDFIASEYGLEGINRLIRSPGELENILGISRAEFEQRWRQFMEQQYKGSSNPSQ